MLTTAALRSQTPASFSGRTDPDPFGGYSRPSASRRLGPCPSFRASLGHLPAQLSPAQSSPGCAAKSLLGRRTGRRAVARVSSELRSGDDGDMIFGAEEELFKVGRKPGCRNLVMTKRSPSSLTLPEPFLRSDLGSVYLRFQMLPDWLSSPAGDVLTKISSLHRICLRAPPRRSSAASPSSYASTQR